jgi:Fe-S-cluster-containing dehydrogenase component
MSDNSSKKYWKSLTRRSDGVIALPIAGDEFPAVPEAQPGEEKSVAFRRRDFLAAAGFAFGSVTLTGCNRAPVEKAIPYLVAPEAIVPGRATYYASTCGACNAGCGLLVKNRDGRAIKLEGNAEHPISHGGLCAVGQASVLGLYDSHRLQHPLQDGKQTTWDAVDGAITRQFDAMRENGATVRLLTGPINSPTKSRVIQGFLKSFANAKHVAYETLSTSAIRNAHKKTHNQSVLPTYAFEKASVIVGFDADFLGTWISPVAFTAGWAKGRRADADPQSFSHHTQFESRFSVTGGKADRRVPVTPAQLGAALTRLASFVASKAGVTFAAANTDSVGVDTHMIDDLATELWHARGKSLVVCGSQDVDAQVVCNFINHTLGNYGATIDITRPAAMHDTSDEDIQALLSELQSGSVDALIIDNVDPAYDLPNGAEFEAAINKAGLVVSFADRLTETSKHATYNCPDHHYLESWGDVNLGGGFVGFQQPVMRPLFKTRSVLESLSVWSGSGSNKSDQALVRETWGNRVAWNKAIHDGFAKVSEKPATSTTFRAATVKPISAPEKASDGKLALVLYPKVAMLDGRNASNPWLHEMPDPITKVVWDNYASIAEATASQLGIETGDIVKITLVGSKSTSIELPALVQPGQHDDVVAIALGYGHPESARFENVGPQWLESKPTLGDNGLVGTNAAKLLTYRDGTLRLSGEHVSIAKTNRKHFLACTQDYHNIEVPAALVVPGMNRRRPMVQETTLAAYKRDGKLPELGHGAHHEDLGDLWPDDHKYEGHHWGMAIDLTSCTGCSACVVSCQVENNVPVVGRDEVTRKRIMHWLRIDRYYCDSADGGEPDILHQPVMCQHCDNAPCETVCPVLATVHSEEGLNMQTYNRCVGTRYCANNCPYKVRRFNWFDYAHEDKLANMSLNPDITVRTRGVMEKCSFCVQRIEEARIEAKKKGLPIADGDIKPACQQSCPAGSIVFGDMNDPGSAVSKLIASGRHYRMLEETNVKPSVGYMGLVRNRDENEDQTHHG